MYVRTWWSQSAIQVIRAYEKAKPSRVVIILNIQVFKKAFDSFDAILI